MFPTFRSTGHDNRPWEDGAPVWVPLDDKFEVMRVPLYDYTAGLFARLDHSEASHAAAKLGARLMTAREYTKLDRIGIRLTPAIIRELPWEKAERISKGRTNELERMGTIEWCGRHDAEVFRQLQGITDFKPVSNCGKMWILDKGPYNFGWFLPSGRPIQSIGTRHSDGPGDGDGHVDYSQLSQFIRGRT